MLEKIFAEINLDNVDLNTIPLIEMKYRKISSPSSLLHLANSIPSHIGNVIKIILIHSRYLFNKYDYCYLDVKVRELKRGDSGDHLNVPHYDWVNDKHHKNKEETHFLYTNTGGTKFLESDVVSGVNEIYKYNRDLHQSPILTEDVKRIMIRLSFVDKLK